jgi:hypothetical protein
MKDKVFDCIKMKEDCQRAVEQRYGGLTIEERNERMVQDIMDHPVLGPFYSKISKKNSLKVAETQAQYGTSRDQGPETLD